MTQPKVQLVAPLGNITVPGMNVTGVVTATIGDVGVAGSIIQGNNIDIGTGIITATSFVGDQIGTYRAASLTGSPDLVVGVVTSSGFVAQITGDVTGDLTGNVVGTAGSILSGKDLWVGIATATLVGPGQNLAGVAGSSFTHQTVTADGATTSINLNLGHIITLNQSASTTLSLSNAKTAQLITIIRRDQTGGTQTLNWPDSISWDGGINPTLLDNTRSTAGQVFNLITRDSGDTWYGWETASLDPQNTALFRWGGDNGRGDGAWNGGYNVGYPRSSPVQLPGAWNGLAAIQGGGNAQAAGTKTDGTLWTWGWNTNGTLGLNNTTLYSSPVQVGTDTTWGNAVAMGAQNENATVVSKTDGTLWIWGENNKGNLGLNSHGDSRSSPCQLPGTWDIAGPKSIMVSAAYGVYAIKGDGTLWTWGQNNYKDLGQNNQTDYSSPTQVGTDATWSSLGARTNGCVAVKTDGTLWSWGRGQYGQLGQNSQTNLESPKQVGSGTDWASTFGQNSGSQLAGAAIKTDGTMWMMGRGTDGQLGQNDTITRSSPVQIPGTTWSTAIFTSEGGCLANKTDGTLWAWGSNANGQLGLNSDNPYSGYSSPVQIPGTSWTGYVGAHEKNFWAFQQSDS